jgi:hypothetical protein
MVTVTERAYGVRIDVCCLVLVRIVSSLKKRSRYQQDSILQRLKKHLKELARAVG